MLCPECHVELPEHATFCRNCTWQAEPTPNLPVRYGIGQDVAALTQSDDEGDALASEQQDPIEDDAQAGADHEARDAEETETQKQKKEEQNEETAGDPALTIEEQLDQIEQSGAFTIGVIGYSTSGKTFFLNRLKHYYTELRHYHTDPHPEDEDLKGTIDLEAHFFEALDSEEDHPTSGIIEPAREDFWIIDIPGEDFKKAVDARLQGPVSDGLMRVLRVAQALIIVLPSNEILTRQPSRAERAEIASLKHQHEKLVEQREEIETKIGALKASRSKRNAAESIALTAKLTGMKTEQGKVEKKMAKYNDILNVETRLRQLLESIADINLYCRTMTDGAGGMSTAAFLGLSPKERRKMARSRYHQARSPFTFVAFAKADLLIGELGRKPSEIAREFPHIVDRFLLDLAPASLFKLYRPKLHRAVVEQFRWNKFDFVTSFDGQPANDKKPRYTLREHYGVAAVVQWIHWARSYSSRIAPGAPGAKLTPLEWLRDVATGIEAWFVRKMSAWNDAAVSLDPAGLGITAACCTQPAASDDEPPRRERSLTLFALAAAVMLAVLATAWLFETIVLAALAPVIGGLVFLLGLALRAVLRRTSPGLLNRVIEYRGKLANRLMKPDSQLPDWFLGIGAGTLFVGWAVLLASLFLGSGSGQFAPEPVYTAELRRMERDAPIYRTGIVQQKLPLWNWIPSRANDGWFTIAETNAAWPHVRAGLRQLPNGAATTMMPTQLTQSIAAFEAAADAIRREPDSSPRAAINYTLGVLYFWSGNRTGAKRNLEVALKAANSVARGTQQGQAYGSTWARVPVVKMLTLQGLGLIELASNQPEQALVRFDEALVEADRYRGEFARSVSASFFYMASSGERAPMAQIDTAELWTNYVAALIAAHTKASLAGNEAASETLRTQMAKIVEEMAAPTRLAEIAAYPLLAANLRIAAARSGKDSLASSFALDEAVGGDAGIVAKQSIQFSGRAPEDQQSKYWATVVKLRQGLAEGDSAGVKNTTDQLVQESPGETEDIKAWVGDAVEQRYHASNGAEQRGLVKAYWPYMSNALLLQVLTKPLILLALIFGLVVLAWGFRRKMFRRIQSDYRQLHLPRHRTNRRDLGGRENVRAG